MGSKIFVNFTKYNFDECMMRLRKEIKSVLPETSELEKSNPRSLIELKSPAPHQPPLQPLNTITLNNPKNWTNKVISKINITI